MSNYYECLTRWQRPPTHSAHSAHKHPFYDQLSHAPISFPIAAEIYGLFADIKFMNSKITLSWCAFSHCPECNRATLTMCQQLEFKISIKRILSQILLMKLESWAHFMHFSSHAHLYVELLLANKVRKVRAKVRKVHWLAKPWKFNVKLNFRFQKQKRRNRDFFESFRSTSSLKSRSKVAWALFGIWVNFTWNDGDVHALHSNRPLYAVGVKRERGNWANVCT